MLLSVLVTASVGAQERVAEGETIVADTASVLLTVSQFLQISSSVDSLDMYQELVPLLEQQKENWKGLYTELDSMYTDLRELQDPQGFTLREGGFWALMGGAATVVIDEVLEE